jgi:hypothetical protein
LRIVSVTHRSAVEDQRLPKMYGYLNVRFKVGHLVGNRREVPLGVDPRLADRHNLWRISPRQKCGSLVRLISGVMRMNPDRSIHPRVRAHNLKCAA